MKATLTGPQRKMLEALEKKEAVTGHGLRLLTGLSDRRTVSRVAGNLMDKGLLRVHYSHIDWHAIITEDGIKALQRERQTTEIRFAIDQSGDGDFMCPHCGGAVDTSDEVKRPLKRTGMGALACLSCKEPLHHPGLPETCEYCGGDIVQCDTGDWQLRNTSPTGWIHVGGKVSCCSDKETAYPKWDEEVGNGR